MESIKEKTNNILFICSGNVCRSVMAEVLLKDKITDHNIHIQSAGISAYSGVSILPLADTVLKEKGIEYSDHKSQPITGELILWADLILTMTRSQKLILLAQLPAIVDRLFTLKEYVGLTECPNIDVPQENRDSYRQCLQEIDRALNLLAEKLT